MLKKLSQIYPPYLELIGIFLLFLVAYLTWTAYPALPDTIPTHFDIQGLPDGWGSKNEILIFPLISLFIFLLLSGIIIAFLYIKDPKKMINLPASVKERITPEQAEILRIFLVRCLFALKILMLGMFTYLLYYNIETALSGPSSAGNNFILFFTAAILILVLYMVYKSFRIAYSAR
jgi:uncharacterized membrane protein